MIHVSCECECKLLDTDSACGCSVVVNRLCIPLCFGVHDGDKLTRHVVFAAVDLLFLLLLFIIGCCDSNVFSHLCLAALAFVFYFWLTNFGSFSIVGGRTRVIKVHFLPLIEKFTSNIVFLWYIWLVLVDSCWGEIIQVKIPSTEKVMPIIKIMKNRIKAKLGRT